MIGNPAKYESWLEGASHRTVVERVPSERLVFINAWNEWAEGCHLEPDREFGRGYLEATQRVKAGRSTADNGWEDVLAGRRGETSVAMLQHAGEQQDRGAQVTAAEAQELTQRLQAIENSTSWRATAPLRALGASYPDAARFIRRTLRVVWWTVTLQLGARLAERRAASKASPSGS